MNTVRRENEKVYIENVRKISWDTGEMCEFASSHLSALACLGENISYHYVMGTSGVAFRFTFNPDKWDYGNYGIRNISPDVYAPIRRSFAASGYACTIHEPASFDEDARKIMDSIDRGIPVLAYPVVGPSDCSIIIGYDEGGQVLLGWSTYQDIPDDHNVPHDVTGYFRKPGWHENLSGYILIGEKVTRHPPLNIYLDSLNWAVYLMRLKGMRGKVTGLEGLLAWAEEMIKPVKVFPEGEDAYFSQFYLSTAINMTMLRDHCQVEPFLLQAIKDVPNFEPELAKAVNCYREGIILRDGMDNLIADNFSPQSMQAIRVAKTRREYADAILHIQALEAEALTYLESLLERISEDD